MKVWVKGSSDDCANVMSKVQKIYFLSRGSNGNISMALRPQCSRGRLSRREGRRVEGRRMEGGEEWEEGGRGGGREG